MTKLVATRPKNWTNYAAGAELKWDYPFLLLFKIIGVRNIVENRAIVDALTFENRPRWYPMFVSIRFNDCRTMSITELSINVLLNCDLSVPIFWTPYCRYPNISDYRTNVEGHTRRKPAT